MGQLLAAGNRTLVLETIIWIGFVVTAVETNMDKSVSGGGGGGSSSLRSVRNAAYAQLSAFFTTYPDYELSATAEKAIFSVFVWRPLANFDSEFIHSPTGLLSLILTWSKEPRHLKYLSATCPDTGLRVLQNICKVLGRAAAAPKVKSAVLELVKNLVTPPGEEPPEAGPSLGVSIVLPELDVLLAHFSDWLRTVGNKGDNKKEAKKGLLKGGLDTRLEILMHLAPHITRADWAAECLHQLLQLLPALKQRPEAVAKVLGIAQNLVAQAGDDSCCRRVDLVEMVLPLLARLTARIERGELVRFVARLAETCSEETNQDHLTRVSHICTSLNAMDRKRMDEPDFELRMRTFLSLREQVKATTNDQPALSYLELAAVVYNCCHALRHEQDSSLKTNALDTLLVSTRGINRLDPDAARKIVNKICLEQVRVGLKAKDDLVICDHLAFLQSLVTNCSEAHARTKDLAKLTDMDDPDADFFENIRHVQLHRRGRAMARLAKQLMEEDKFLLPKNLTQLLLPVCTAFLLKETYVKHSQLVEQAIELLGAICHALPWQQYETYVRQGALVIYSLGTEKGRYRHYIWIDQCRESDSIKY
jgi:U3 small nucleolar RNA-associated protein 20